MKFQLLTGGEEEVYGLKWDIGTGRNATWQEFRHSFENIQEIREPWNEITSV